MNTTREAFLSLFASDKEYYEPILEAAKKECKELISSFYDDKELIAGWGHNFVCPDCGGETERDYSGDMFSATGKQTKKCSGNCKTCSGCK